MRVLIVQLSIPWAIFQNYNCSHNEERGACLLPTLSAQGFELSLGGGLHKKNPEISTMPSISQSVIEATSIEVSYCCVFFSVV